MPFEIKKTEIDGLLIIHPHIFNDHRGIYRKNYEKNIFKDAGIECEFTESSEIISCKGALRGLHYQTKNSQAKLIHVIKGSLYDVAIDLRPDSKSFGKYYSTVINADDHTLIYIPEGFAHGYLSLTEDSIFSYECSGEYIPEFCGGIIWNDLSLNIPWPTEEYGIEEVILSDKDKKLETFKEYLLKNIH